jgi:rSAM/selenodomain-associated transferase 2
VTGPALTVVVPTLDEAAQVEDLLDHLQEQGARDVVVVDGGSRDGTPDLAAAHPLAPRVLRAGGGRAAQLNAGAAAAPDAEGLVFLHADSRLPPGGLEAVGRALAGRWAVGGNFALRFGDGRDRFSRVLAAVYAAQRRLGFYYGDSTIWCSRSAFDALGGYRLLPIMDDYDFVRRLERHGPTVCLPGPATTSDRRWRSMGIPRTVLSWVVIRWLYVLGVPPARLVQLYRVVR